MSFAWSGVLFVGGYVAAVFTWDKVHTFIVGAETKIIDLRNKARALEAAVRGK